MIHFDAAKRRFHLRNKAFSYLLGLAPDGDLRHLYLGAPLDDAAVDAAVGPWDQQKGEFFREGHRRDFASFGSNDLRVPAILVEHADGSRLSYFSYQSHATELPPLSGLPQAQGPCETLSITLHDPHAQQTLVLSYRLFDEVLVRRASLRQDQGSAAVRKLCSLSMDLAPGTYEALSLAGTWARERQEQRTKVPQAILRFESRRGITSHQLAPFVALGMGELQQDEGAVLGLSLLYSGNWLIECEGHFDGGVRVNAGLNDFDFRWDLQAGQSLDGPEVVLAWSPRGLNGVSQALHRFVKKHILDPHWQAHTPPVLINSWEAKYFNFKHQDIVEFAREAKDLGVDLVVLDDGWFGKRDDDKSSLGDWFDDTAKLPGGVQALAEEIHGLGLRFGLWFEPEMISPKSQLFGKHPDWALLPQGGRPASEARWQYVLDMGRAEVRDYLFERLSHYIQTAKLDYIKWDMNRALWELPSPASSHRFELGLYELMARVKKAFPTLLIEGCAGGGARFDYGILSFHPQIWCSDNTDGLDRLGIQWGTSYFAPPRCMGAHISAVPNHITHRSTPLDWRAHVALAGSFGLELDPVKLSAEERAQVRAAVARSRQLWPYLRDGDFYRIEGPKEGRTAWSLVLPQGQGAVVFVYQRLAAPPRSLSLQGLDPARRYRLDGQVFSGQELEKGAWTPPLPAGEMKSGLFLIEP